jgi:hypothetical protein
MTRTLEEIEQNTEYHDMDGNPVTLYMLCNREPHWARVRLLAGLQRIEDLEAQLDGYKVAEEHTTTSLAQLKQGLAMGEKIQALEKELKDVQHKWDNVQPRHVYVIDNTGHYVNVAVFTELQRLMAAIEEQRKNAVYAREDRAKYGALADTFEKELEGMKTTLCYCHANVKAMRNALRMIAGTQPCVDPLMGNVEIATAALAATEEFE